MVMTRLVHLLAQESLPKRSWESWSLQDSTKLLTVIGALVVLAFLGGMILMFLRRRMVARESALESPGSLMDQLAVLRRQGKLTETEYEAARKAASTKLAASMNARSERARIVAAGSGGASAQPIRAKVLGPERKIPGGGPRAPPTGPPGAGPPPPHPRGGARGGWLGGWAGGRWNDREAGVRPDRGAAPQAAGGWKEWGRE